MKSLKSFHDGMMDVTHCLDIEITVSQLGPNMKPVLHVNTKDGCLFRVCMIMGQITIKDSTSREKVIDINEIEYFSPNTVTIRDENNEQNNKNVLPEEPQG
jgi:hypothetical protein